MINIFHKLVERKFLGQALDSQTQYCCKGWTISLKFALFDGFRLLGLDRFPPCPGLVGFVLAFMPELSAASGWIFVDNGTGSDVLMINL